MFFTISICNAATFFSRQNGNWTSRSTWSYTSGGGQVPSGVYPAFGDIVHIEGGDVVTLTANAACATIDFPTTNTNNSIVLAGYTLAVSGNISIPRSGNGLNLINVGSGTLTAASIDFPTTGDAVRHKITISTGTVSVSGNISTNSSSALSATIEFTGAGLLRVGGDFFSSGGGSLTPSTGTVELNGANQSFNAFSYYNLTLSGSGTKSFFSTTSTTVTNNLTINSGVKANLSTLTHTANKLTLGSTQVLPSSWGSSGSSATNKSDAYFAVTTGLINATTSTCSSFTTVTPITNVAFNTLNKTTAATDATAYQNYTGDTPTTVAKTQYYTLTVKGNTGGDVNGYYTAFIDWNNDGDFDDSGESIVLGTIKNSSGTDSKVTSAYIQIPSGAITGNVKMRIIGRIGGYSSTPCVVSGSTGQMQDYTINVLAGCTDTLPSSVTTSSTATSVCPYSPFTLSLGSTFGEGATYLWETSPTGSAPWTSAPINSIPFFSNDFSVNQGFNTTVGDISLAGEDAQITGGVLVLTETAPNGHNSGFLINKSNTANINPFTATFKYRIWDGGGADGMSLSYGPGFAANAGGGESGEGSGLIVQFDTYDNEGVGTGGSRVRILYNNTSIFNTAIDTPFNLRTDPYRDVKLYVDSNGLLSLAIQNQAGTNITVVSKLLLPNYTTTNKSTWKFKFSARTGGTKDRHSLDDVVITYLDSANSNSKFTTSQTVKTYYRATITCGGSIVTSDPIMVDITSATITAMTASACSGVAFTVTPANGTNGTIPSGTTYSWPAPVVTGGITGGAASTGTPASITGTISNTTGTAQTATYTVTPTTAGCTGIPFTVTVTVNTLPTPTFTAQPGAAACANTDVTYTTQTGMSNYVWGFPGVLGTDYTITSGGSNLSNTVTLKYITATNKTVTINYTNTNGCTATSATSSTATTISPSTVGGTVGGSTTVCTGTNSTILTLAGHTGSIIRWESSLDNFATAGTPIVNTTTTLTATNLTATTSYRAVVQSGSCGALNSVAATVTVSPATVAGTIGGGTTVCTGTNSTVLTLSGHNGSVVRWESSLNNFSTAGTPIINTTTTLTATNLTATTSYRAVVQSGSCGALNSVAATVTVSPATVSGTVGGGATVCTGTNSTVLTLSGHTGSIVRWESSLDNFATAGTPITNTTTTLTATNLTATTSYRAVVQSGSCGALNSIAATVAVSPATVAGTVGGGATVCTGTNSTALTLTGHTGSVVRWESSLNNFATAGTPIVNTTTTLTATNLT
ncbi:MAG: hypothetical protein EOO85_10200, partial [Pedobacter sp.]